MLGKIAILAAIFQVALSACPEVTSTDQRTYPTGSQLMIRCPNDGALMYTATCRESSLWTDPGPGDCGQPNVLPPVTLAPPTPPPDLPQNLPGPQGNQNFPVVGVCPFLQGFMRSADNSNVYVEGQSYDMTCPSTGSTFIATCRDSAWVYPIDSCQVVQVSPTNPPLVPPGPGPTAGPPPAGLSCVYQMGFMSPNHSSSTYPPGSLYRMQCPLPNPSNLFTAECRNDGNWYGSLSDCDGGLLGGLFAPRTVEVIRADDYMPCPYIAEVMLASDASSTFPHGTLYNFRCLMDDRVRETEVVECKNGVWHHVPGSCMNAGIGGGLGGFLGSNVAGVPLWLLLAGR